MASGSRKRKVPDSLRLGDDSDAENDDKSGENKKTEEKAPEKEEKKAPVDEKRLKTTLDLDSFKCCICLNIWHDVVCVSPCQHNFCNACFSEWYKRSTNGCKCPQCRNDIVYACKNHAMATVVDDLLSNNPSLKRSQDEIEKMDKTAVVTSTFMKLNNPKPITMSNFRATLTARMSTGGRAPSLPLFPPEDNEEDEDGESLHSESDDSRDADHDNDYEAESDDEPEERSCRQCQTNNSGFQCSPGSAHLLCRGCACEMPDRADVSVPQKCAACSVVYCDAYWRSQNLTSDSGEAGCPNGRLLPISERPIPSFPRGTHKFNTTEQEFTGQYITQHGLTVEAVVRDWMAKVDRSEIALSGIQATSTSALCNLCAETVISQLLDKFRMSIPKTELPPEAARRDDCWYGHACRTQVHNAQHAKKLNHMCEPTARNVVLH